jgi:ATP-dependent Clp protease adaptor protein ClpS
MSTYTETKKKSKYVVTISNTHKLILHNDDVNTFDFVIKCLVNICDHEYEQATQCANIVHNNGKCDIKYGDREKLTILKEKLVILGLSVTIEEN